MIEGLELIKRYSECPQCGSKHVGGTPPQGTLVVEEHTFTRSCACGWSVSISKRIEVVACATARKNGKTIGVFELKMPDRQHKYVDLQEVKEKAGAVRVNQTKRIEAWLNTEEGRAWAVATPEASAFF